MDTTALATILVLFGCVAALLNARRIIAWLKARRAARAPAVPAKSPDEITKSLYRHAAAIEAFVEKSAHPRELLDHEDFKQAAALLRAAPAAMQIQFATGASWPLACVALFVLTGGHDISAATLIPLLPRMRAWTIYYALDYLNALTPRVEVGAPLAVAIPWWSENPTIIDIIRDYLETRRKQGDTFSFGDALDRNAANSAAIATLLDRIGGPCAELLRAKMRQWQAERIDRGFLSSVGRFWTPSNPLLAVPESWRVSLKAATAAVLNTPRRSVLVAGEPRVGKSAFLMLVGHELAAQGWTIFEASGAELMAGQIYIGQLEERIRAVVNALDARKKIAWHVPDLLALARSGTHQGQSASILDQIFAAVSNGTLVLLSEASPSGVARLLQTRPSLRPALEVCRFDPMSEAETQALTHTVAGRISAGGAVTVTPAAIASVLQLSHQYLGASQLPGSTLDFLKRAAGHAAAAGRKSVEAEDALDTLSQISGLPRSILDDNQRLDLEAVRAHFTARVIGQDEAVNVVIDRIAMLKAGLVDPHRPIGVFLFAGPTGTGKTELAKTLADYLFGSAERMARLDMSELQAPESTAKILGQTYGDAESLAEKVRKQPFSVVLLDEFEKAHANVWDLFLQVFDDGRLTDAQGRLVDFHHTIIVLTTNLGATAHAAAAIGFARSRNDYSADQVLQAVSRTFRPEFINRLDKILVFRPLSRDFMRRILEKELAQVLERRGLRQRDWAVEWEDSALAFLLDRGFSPDMGARPLRRAIDEHLLAPLAATLVEHRYPDGDQFLFVKSDGHAIQVEFVDPDATMAQKPVDGVHEDSLARIILHPHGDGAETRWLVQTRDAAGQLLASGEWRAAKDTLLAQVNAPGIWQNAQRTQLFSRLELIDRVEEAGRTAERLAARLDSARPGSGGARELAARLALQLHLVNLGIDDVTANAPVDALLMVEPVLSGDGADHAAWSRDVLAMYRGWAQLRHMKIAEIRGDGPAILHITGFGAWRILSEEAGLHLLESETARQVARVRVSAGPQATATDSYAALRRLVDASDPSTIVRRYRGGAAALVRDAKRGWRTGNLDAVLAGNFDLIGLEKAVD